MAILEPIVLDCVPDICDAQENVWQTVPILDHLLSEPED